MALPLGRLTGRLGPVAPRIACRLGPMMLRLARQLVSAEGGELERQPESVTDVLPEFV
jgi:hypothetical protein